MSPVEIFKTIKELMDLDRNTIVIIIIGIIMGIVATCWFLRRSISRSLRIYKDNTELENDLLKAYSDIGRLREEVRRLKEECEKLLRKTGQPTQSPPDQQPSQPENELTSGKKTIYGEKTVAREDVIAAMKDIDAKGGPKWVKNHKWAVRYEGQSYPPKDLLGKVIQAERLADFNTADAIWVLEQLGFEIVPRPKPESEQQE
jgi:hypothetical protein